MVGTNLRNDSEELNEWAKELVQEYGIENFLKETDFVFMMHQGYMGVLISKAVKTSMPIIIKSIASTRSKNTDLLSF